METNDTLANELLAKLCAQPILVAFFHDKDDVGPAEMPWGDTNTGTFFCSGRAHEITVNTIEDALGSQASSAILAANEEKFHQYVRTSMSSQDCGDMSCLARLQLHSARRKAMTPR